MSINENDLPTRRRYNIDTSFPTALTTTTTSRKTTPELPAGSRRFNVEVGFPQSHVSTGQTETVDFITGPKGPPGPQGPDEVWVGTEPPTDPEIDLWYDSDAVADYARGPQGPPGGPTVVPLAYTDWPPVDPQPDILYLRLAP